MIEKKVILKPRQINTTKLCFIAALKEQGLSDEEIEQEWNKIKE